GLADLGADVEGFGPGKRAQERQAMREALGGLDLQRVKPALAERIPIYRDRGELWERPQSLSQELRAGEAGVGELEAARSHSLRSYLGTQQGPVRSAINVDPVGRQAARRIRIHVEQSRGLPP